EFLRVGDREPGAAYFHLERLEVTLDARIVLREQGDVPDAAPLRFLHPAHALGFRRRDVREVVRPIANRGDGADTRMKDPRLSRQRPCDLTEPRDATDDCRDPLVLNRSL